MRVRGHIRGHVPSFAAQVRGRRLVIGGEGRIRLVLDTGFTGSIALPPTLLARLRLDEVGAEPYILADGSAVVARVYEGVVVLGGQARPTEIISSDGDPLIGMQFIEELVDSVAIHPRRRQVVMTLRRARRPPHR